MSTDVQVINHGTIVSFHPLTVEGREWLQELPTETWQWFGTSLNLDHRCAGPVIEGMVEAGLVVA